METISSPADLRGRVRPALQAGKTIGFVPTMGALHEGHASLIRRARTENDLLVVSVFVNPAQFGPTEDLDRYPRDVPRDTALCEREKVDLLFLPRVADIYPPGFDTFVAPGRAAEGLCGASRPDLFRGAATVVLKLFNIVSPTRAYFGEKDYQQLAVIRQMATDLDLDVEIVPCPTVREADGLAMSSRNALLSPGGREAAAVLSRALREIARTRANGERRVSALRERGLAVLGAEPAFTPEYLEIRDAGTLDPIETCDRPAVALVAGRIGSVRLIDNVRLPCD